MRRSRPSDPLSSVLRCMLFLMIAGTFSAAHAQTLTTLLAFNGTDGSEPFQSNLLDVGGTLYGTTGAGGTYNAGTIFKLDSSGKETVIYNFTGGADGSQPSSGLTLDSTTGNVYGTTFYGGDSSCVLSATPGCGVVYKLTQKGKFSVFYTFTGSTDGALPQGVIPDSAGNIYGPAFYGGNLSCPLTGIGCGVIFKIDTTGKETPIYTFQDGTDGGVPNGFITMDVAGNIYGAATVGGTLADCGGAGCGVIFKLTPAGKETVLYSFTGGTDGGGPNGNLLMDPQGNIYGTAFFGGDLQCTSIPNTTGCGVVFKLTQSGHESVLHPFNGTDGAGPSWGLLDYNGNGYSTTIYGGANGFGTIFELTSKGKELPLYSFADGADGAYPQSGLIVDKSGNMFSNTVFGGNLSCNSPSGCGTVFKFVP